MTEITHEQQKAIKKLFKTGFIERPEFEFYTLGDAYEISVSMMYDYLEPVEGKSMLTVLQSIAKILGCAEGGEVGRDEYPGCETCDYGSRYVMHLRFWSPL